MLRTTLAMVALLVAAISYTSARAEYLTASVELKDADGNVVATAMLKDTSDGVHLTVSATDVAPGSHGIHFHAVGLCEGPDFTTAGKHINLDGSEHGLDNPNGPHDGDLPAIEVEDDGAAEYEAKTDRITLSDGDMSVFDDDGSALIIHADPDDQTTDPTGNSGDRVACGALELMELPDTGAGGTAANGGLPLLPAAALGLLIVCSALIARRRFER